MTVSPDTLLLIVGCMAVTLIPRILPMMLVNRIRLPVWFLAWLQYMPLAMITTLLCREMLFSDGALRQWNDPYLLAAAPTLFIAFISRSVVLTIIGGGAVFLLLRYVL